MGVGAVGVGAVGVEAVCEGTEITSRVRMRVRVGAVPAGAVLLGRGDRPGKGSREVLAAWG